jgi:hypothetical protein
MMFLSNSLKKAERNSLTHVLTINPRLRFFFKIVRKREMIRIPIKKLLNPQLEAIKDKAFLTPKLESFFMMLVIMKRVPRNLRPNRIHLKTIYF